MTDGTNKMTVADKLAMRLKESELGQLLSEDDIILIASEAIQKAFFQPRIDNSDKWHTKTLEPLIVELSRNAFTEKFKEMVEPVIKQFMEADAFKDALAAASAALLPQVLTGLVSNTIHSAAQQAMQQSLQGYDFVRQLKEALQR